MAGKVAPMASVAGNKRKKVPPKVTPACQAAEGAGPSRVLMARLAGSRPQASSSPHDAIAASQPAYQRPGRALRSTAAPRQPAPRASPPKKAATTAKAAAPSWPNHSVAWCVQTIW